MSAALQVSLFRSSRFQRWKGAELLARRDVVKSPSAHPRVGVAIDADEHSSTLLVEAVADRLATEPNIANVSVVASASPSCLRRLVRTYKLDRLVLGAQSGRWIENVSSGALEGDKLPGTIVRVVDLGCFCDGIFGSEEATARALRLLLAAAARVRLSGILTPADVDDELCALLGGGDVGLSPCVPLLACPAGLANLRILGQLGVYYSPGAIPLEVPCHLNSDHQLTARALELGADAVLVMGCVPACARGCRNSKRRPNRSNGHHRAEKNWEEESRATMTVSGFASLAEALATCLNMV